MRFIRRDDEQGCHDDVFRRGALGSQRDRERLRVLVESKPGGRLLEVGCGAPAGLLRLAEARFDVEGIDVSQAVIAALRPHFGERVRVLDIADRPLPRARRYDAIAAFSVLEHVREPQRVVDKLHDALADDGVLVGSVPNDYGLIGGLDTRLGRLLDRTRVSTFAPDVWWRIFHDAGFGSVDFFGEITLLANRCRYLRGPRWPHLSFNIVFVCTKEGAAA